MNAEDSATPAGSIELRLLGLPAARLPGGPWRALSDNDAAMFALLALRGEVPRAWLAALLWPHSAPAKARSALRQRGHKLRAWAGQPLLIGQGDVIALAHGVQHDLRDPEPALRADANAVAGKLLGEQTFAGQPALAMAVEQERQGWLARVHQALSRLAAQCEPAGQIVHGLALAQRLLLQEPLHEHSVRLVMRLHHRRGDRGAALEAFEQLRKNLYDELGEPPADETVTLAQAIACSAVQGAPAVTPVPLALQHPPRTVGRDAAFKMAEQCRRAGAAVLLTGAAGIGKTRVFDDLLRHWQVAVVCRLQPGDAKADLCLLGRLAAALPPQMMAGADDEVADLLRWLAQPRTSPPTPGIMRRERLAMLLGRALADARKGGVHTIAIDDLHFADGDSLDLLCPYFSRVGEVPHWLLTSRDSPLPTVLAEWLSTAIDTPSAPDPQVALAPLAHGELIDLLASMGPPQLDLELWATALHAHCGGHPLSVIQVLRALNHSGALRATAPPPDLPMPQEVLQRTARALDRGDARAQQLAFIAALAGADFSPGLASQLMACSASQLAVPWRQLESLGILRGAGFSHELMRQAVVDSVPAELAPAIHGEIAQGLTCAGAATASLAGHWEAAGKWHLAAQAGTRAAQASLVAGLHAKARQRWLHAAALFQRAGLIAEAFDARWQAGTSTRSCVSAAEATAQARALLADATSSHQRARALCLLSETHAEEHDPAALAEAQEALALANGLGDATLRATAALREAAALRLVGQWSPGLQRLQALQLDRLSDRDRVAADMLHALLLEHCGQRSAAAARCVTMFEQALEKGDLVQASEMASLASMRLGNLCRIDEALDYSERSNSLSRQAGWAPAHLLIDDLNIAALCADLGHFSRAIEDAEHAAQGMRAAGSWGWMVSAENLLASVFTTMGRLDLASQVIGDTAPQAPTWARAMRHAAQARLGQACGQSPLLGLREAAALLDSGGALHSDDVRQRVNLELARWSDAQTAALQAQHTLAWARSNEHVALARMAGLVAVEAATRLGNKIGAATAADELAASIGEQWPTYNLYLPELWWTLCMAWDESGQPARARTLARHAAHWIDDRARHHVPDLFRAHFLERNPLNRALLKRAVTPR